MVLFGGIVALQSQHVIIIPVRELIQCNMEAIHIKGIRLYV